MANRNIRCNDCGECKTFSQKQWREKTNDLGGKNEKDNGLRFKRRFNCATCNALKNSDPFLYQLMYGKPIKDLKKSLRGAYREYFKSKDKNVNKLQEDFNKIFSNSVIKELKLHNPILHHHTGKDGVIRIDGITIKSFPYKGDYYIPLYTKRKPSY